MDDATTLTPTAGPTAPPAVRAVDFDRRLLELAGRQHYVVARDQLREFGTRAPDRAPPRDGPTRACARGRVPGRRARRDTWHQQLLAACLASSGANAVSFRAAAQMWGLPGGDEIVEVTAPRHRRMQFDDVHDPRELLSHRPRRHVSARHPGDPAGPGASATSASSSNAASSARARSSSRCRKRCAATSSTSRASGASGNGSAACCDRAVASSRSCSPTSCRRSARPTRTPELQLLQLLRAAGLPEPVPQYRVRPVGDAVGPARLRVARREGLLRVRSVQVARRPRQVHARHEPPARARGPRVVRRPGHRRRARLRRAARDRACSANASPAPAKRRLRRCVSNPHTVWATDASGSALFAGAAGAAGVAVDGQVDQAVQQRRVRHARSLPTAWGTSRSA